LATIAAFHIILNLLRFVIRSFDAIQHKSEINNTQINLHYFLIFVGNCWQNLRAPAFCGTDLQAWVHFCYWYWLCAVDRLCIILSYLLMNGDVTRWHHCAQSWYLSIVREG
jgi:hypothetical protein